MLCEYKYGDILLKRVCNGWIVVTGSEYNEEDTISYVYEDTESGEMKESFYNLICDQFGHLFQSKREDGLKVSFSHLSKEEESEEK
jgi:hypothetical protein